MNQNQNPTPFVLRFLFCLFLFGTAQAAVAANEAPTCATPIELTRGLDQLPNSARRMQRDKSLHVVFVGAGAMAGIGTSSKDTAFPRRFEVMLRKELPWLTLRVSNFSTRFATLAKEVTTIQRKAMPLQPDLVIWQIAIPALSGHIPEYRFNEQLESGLDAIAAGGATDTLLMDIHFYKGMDLLIQDDEYREIIEFQVKQRSLPLVATEKLVALWLDDMSVESLQVENTLARSARARADHMHDCLGWVIAQAVSLASKENP